MARRTQQVTRLSVRSDHRRARVQWLGAALVALVTIMCFAGALDGQFLNWDDQRNFVDNPHYRGLGATQLWWMFTTFHMGPYQPLSWLSLAIDHARCGMQPSGYHLTSILLHALNAVLTYFLIHLLLERTGKDTVRAFAAAAGALFFAVHPLRVESVAWLTERRDVLSQSFLLLALLAYCKRRRKTAIAAYALALLAKASGMTLPLALLVLDALDAEDRRPSWLSLILAKWPFALLAAGAAVLAYHGQQEAGAVRSLADHPLLARLVQSGFGLWFYVQKTLVPARLSPLYELDRRFGPWRWPYWAGLAAAIVITLCLLLLRRRSRAPWCAWSSYVILVAPVLGLTQSGPQLAADRYTYLACLPFAVLISAALQRLARGRAFAVPAVIMVVWLAGLGWLTLRQTRIWHDSVSLWQHALALDEQSFLARANLGFAYEANHDYERALPLFRRALELRPDDVRTRHTLALTLAHLHDYAGAISEWQRVIALEPDHADALYSLGLASSNLGRNDAAILYYRRTVVARPDYRDAWLNLRAEYTRAGRRAEANECAQKILAIDRQRGVRPGP